MTLGILLKQRMAQLGYDVKTFAKETTIKEELIQSMLADRITADEIGPHYLAVISCTLMCEPDFFTNESVRQKDLLYVYDRHSVEENRKIAKVQSIARESAFLEKLLQRK